MRLADANRMLHLREEGIEQAKEALEIYTRLDEAVEQAECSVALAFLFRGINQLDAAKEAGFRALDLLPEKGNQFLVCRCHRVLGLIYRSQGEIEKAIHHFETALGIASSFNWDDQLVWIHCDMARLFFYEDMLDDAHTHVEYAKSFAVNNPYYLGRMIQLRAEIWYTQDRVEEAKSDFLYAAEVLEKLRATVDLERCKWFLAEIDSEQE